MVVLCAPVMFAGAEVDTGLDFLELIWLLEL